MLRLLQILRNTHAAIDLASIMVGIIVIGIIGGVIAASIFAVIPWAQDNGAKQQLDSAQTAESAYAGLHDGNYSATLGDLFNSSKAGVNITSNETTCFIAFKKSATGKLFYITSANSKAVLTPTPWPATAPADIPTGCNWPSSADIATPSLTTNLITSPIPTPANPYNVEVGGAGSTASVTFPTTGGPQNDGYQRITFTQSAATDNLSIVLSPAEYNTPLKKNTTYTFTEEVRPSVDVTAPAVVFFFGNPSYNLNSSNQTFPANKWTKLSYTFTTDANATVNGFWPQFRVGGPATDIFTAGTSLDATEAMVTEGADPSRQFADGDTPGWSWTGAAGASTSTGTAIYN